MSRCLGIVPDSGQEDSDMTDTAPFAARILSRPTLIGMLHVPALPGTPGHSLPADDLVKAVVREADIYRACGVDTVMIENMHDAPYVRNPGPEVTATLAVVGRAVRDLGLTCGVQVLAGANREAVAVAAAAGLAFVRVEGFVFAHVADEGLIESCAGDLLRYRRSIGADGVAVFADIKKKHSSHALTADVSLEETAAAAEFFLADGVIVTGSVTGSPPDPGAVARVGRAVRIPVLVGSGVTVDNVGDYAGTAHGLIVGSSVKQGGHWSAPLCPERVEAIVGEFRQRQRS